MGALGDTWIQCVLMTPCTACLHLPFLLLVLTDVHLYTFTWRRRPEVWAPVFNSNCFSETHKLHLNTSFQTSPSSSVLSWPLRFSLSFVLVPNFQSLCPLSDWIRQVWSTSFLPCWCQLAFELPFSYKIIWAFVPLPTSRSVCRVPIDIQIGLLEIHIRWKTALSPENYKSLTPCHALGSIEGHIVDVEWGGGSHKG